MQTSLASPSACIAADRFCAPISTARDTWSARAGRGRWQRGRITSVSERCLTARRGQPRSARGSEERDLLYPTFGVREENMRAAKAHGRDGERRHELSSAEREDLLRTLKARFEKHSNRHKGAEWANVQARLDANPAKLWSLYEMEKTGGEPDVVDDDGKSGECLFFDCSAESPKGRRSCCYDREALDARKEHKPKTSAVEMATAMGIDILTEAQYRELQTLGSFDTKTSSWVQT